MKEVKRVRRRRERRREREREREREKGDADHFVAEDESFELDAEDVDTCVGDGGENGQIVVLVAD